ncbi:MAG: hypothetical protein ACE5ED_09770 [Rhodothalassiaceae bacterium]
MARIRLAALRPYLRRVAAALSELDPEDRQELVQMLELGVLIREARNILIREIDRADEDGEE